MNIQNDENDIVEAPFAKLLGVELVDKSPGHPTVRMQVKKEHLNSVGITHGGVVFSLADVAFAICCNYTDDVAVAINVDMEYVKPTGLDDILYAEAIEEKRTRSLSFCKIIVKTGGREGAPVAFAQALAFIRR
ncbi:MAG: PaaI family thioesterase [Methermicoccaceae archaeon]